MNDDAQPNPGAADVKRHEDSERRHIELAVAADIRHETYFLTLIFTILAASIETAHWSTCRWCNSVEILGWAFLFASGIVGLLRSERAPGIYRLAANRAHEKAMLAFLENTAASFDRSIKATSDSLDRYEEAITDEQQMYAARYRWQRWLFIAGIGLVIVQRAFEGFVAH